MIGEICSYCNNWFEIGPDGSRMVYPGVYEVKGGGVELPFLQPGQYFRIVGSHCNDGVHVYPEPLEDEVFSGEIWAMRPPKAFLDLVARIGQWEEDYGEVARNPNQRETVQGVYSFSKGGNSDWRRAFDRELQKFRKLR